MLFSVAEIIPNSKYSTDIILNLLVGSKLISFSFYCITCQNEWFRFRKEDFFVGSIQQFKHHLSRYLLLVCVYNLSRYRCFVTYTYKSRHVWLNHNNLPCDSLVFQARMIHVFCMGNRLKLPCCKTIGKFKFNFYISVTICTECRHKECRLAHVGSQFKLIHLRFSNDFTVTFSIIHFCRRTRTAVKAAEHICFSRLN